MKVLASGPIHYPRFFRGRKLALRTPGFEAEPLFMALGLDID